MRTRDDMNAHELADSTRSGRARVSRRFHCSHVTAHDRRYQPRADLLVADQGHISSLHHRIGSFDHRNQSLSLDHSKSFHTISSLAISHWSLVIGHWSLVIGHWSLVIGHHYCPNVRATDARRLLKLVMLSPLRVIIDLNFVPPECQ